MQQSNTYKINKRLLSFIFFFLLSLWLVIDSHVYHKVRFVKSANWFSGNILNLQENFNSYLKLKEYNTILVWENRYLKNKLYNQNLQEFRNKTVSYLGDSIPKFYFFDASVIKNSYLKSRNYITIDKGAIDGISPDMGVLGTNGIVGIVESTSRHFSSVLSVLNTDSKINASIKGNNAFGTLIWSGLDFTSLKLTDIPKSVDVKVGDTIVTAGMSHIFPKGINIGVVTSFRKYGFNNYYDIDIKMLNDMSNLGPVYVIKNNFKEEIEELEKKGRDVK